MILEKFKNRFRGLVDQLEMTKKKCAKEIGISYKMFNNAYTLGKVPRLHYLVQIADYFDVSLEYLVGRTDKKERIKNSLRKWSEFFYL